MAFAGSTRASLAIPIESLGLSGIVSSVGIVVENIQPNISESVASLTSLGKRLLASSRASYLREASWLFKFEGYWHPMRGLRCGTEARTLLVNAKGQRGAMRFSLCPRCRLELCGRRHCGLPTCLAKDFPKNHFE